MAVERVQQVLKKQPVIESQVQLQEFQQQRLNLFTASSFERAQSLNFSDGARVDVPFMNDQDRDLAGKLFGSVPTEKREELQTSFDALTHLIREEGANNPDGVKVGDFSSGLTGQLGQTIEVYMTTTAVEEAGDAVQAVMFGAMIGVEQELGKIGAILAGDAGDQCFHGVSPCIVGLVCQSLLIKWKAFRTRSAGVSGIGSNTSGMAGGM